VEEKDEKRKFLRWPVDIETDKQAAKERAESAKRETKKKGKADGKTPDKKAEVAPGKLWCAFDGGFLVKQSRYIETTKTKRVPYFHVLSIDLGNRFAAAFTRFRIHADENGDGRVISADGSSPVIRAEYLCGEKLCLQGEGAEVWRLVSEKNKEHIEKKLQTKGIKREPVVGTYELVEETYGNGGRGRFPTKPEYDVFEKLAARLVPVKSLSLDGTKEQTYPELGDHLIFRLKRRIGRLRTLFNLTWRLLAKHDRKQSTGTMGKERSKDDVLFHRRMVVETLARSKFPKRPRQEGEAEEPSDVSLRDALASDDRWQKLKDDGLLESVKGAAEKKRRADLEGSLKDERAWNWDKLAKEVMDQIENHFSGKDSLDRLLMAVIEFCLPLRGRHWSWDSNRKARLHWDQKDEAHNPNIQGMRGLSMKRLEQILNLRQRCQSFAKLEDRYHGPYKAGNYNPPDSNRDERPDVCPLLLERSNRIREQRVDQTAHLILAEALGMELKNPAEVEKKKERKLEVDLHGEYQRRKDKHGKPYPRCSIIVLENLDRYKMSLGRTKSENSRLMKWAHGKILDKLEDMCRPFGITLMLVDPAFSSHFDSRTGLPGVRVNQVSAGFHEEYPYNRWIEGKTKANKLTKLAEDIKRLAQQFAEHPEYRGELVLAVEGGKEFVPVMSPNGGEGLINADICAAGNIGLRGVADPQRWDVFPRLRTKQISETEVSVTNWRGWFGKFPQDTKDKKSEQRRMRAATNANDSTNNGTDQVGDNADLQSSQSSEYPPFFVEHPDSKYDWLRQDDWLEDKAFTFIQGGQPVRAFRQGEYLKRVERECEQRILKINHDRLHKK
jgi:IS605 OrfB family transposase